MSKRFLQRCRGSAVMCAYILGAGLCLQPGGSVQLQAQSADQPASQSFAIRKVRVFDGERVLPGTDVLVINGRISAVGRNLSIPAGTHVIDGGERTLLPGFIDAHTHAFGNARRDAIRFGVTTELDMFGDWRALPAARQQRESLAPATLADLWSAGTLATVAGGHGTQFGFEIPTLSRAADAAAFVKARIAEGSDYLKLVLEDGSAYGRTTPTLDVTMTRALVDAARSEGILAVAHVATLTDAMAAIEAGAHGLVHISMDQALTPAVVRLSRERGTFVVPTLSVVASIADVGAGHSLREDAAIKPWLTQEQSAALARQFPSQLRRPAYLENALASVRRLHSAGVPILAGTDAGNPGTAHGASMHGELALLVEAGLSPTAALAAATAVPARVFNLHDRGRIAPGLRADLVLMEGDPTRNIVATRAIAGIWKNGVAVDRALQPTERAQGPAPMAPQNALVADFESGEIAVRFGQNWIGTTDRYVGGRSTAELSWSAPGARGSKGALRVQGEVAEGLQYAWAGVLFSPGSGAFEPVDFSRYEALLFQVRGDARQADAQLFSGVEIPRTPPAVRFDITAQWTTIRIELERFAGADRGRLRALALTAGLPAGTFTFEIDDVRFE
jgi:imidazolonepropionase-like amidohydrolase